MQLTKSEQSLMLQQVSDLAGGGGGGGNGGLGGGQAGAKGGGKPPAQLARQAQSFTHFKSWLDRRDIAALCLHATTPAHHHARIMAPQVRTLRRHHRRGKRGLRKPTAGQGWEAAVPPDREGGSLPHQASHRGLPSQPLMRLVRIVQVVEHFQARGLTHRLGTPMAARPLVVLHERHFFNFAQLPPDDQVPRARCHDMIHRGPSSGRRSVLNRSTAPARRV